MDDLIKFILCEKINYFYNTGISSITFCNILNINSESEIIELPIETYYIFNELNDIHDEIDRKIETISILDEMSATIRTRNPLNKKIDLKLMGKDGLKTVKKIGKGTIVNATNPQLINNFRNAAALGILSGQSPTNNVMINAIGKVAIPSISKSIETTLEKNRKNTYNTAERIIQGIQKRRQLGKIISPRLLAAEKKSQEIINNYLNDKNAEQKISKLTNGINNASNVLDTMSDGGINLAKYATKALSAIRFGAKKIAQFSRKDKSILKK